jgi:hypothetical protein
MKVCPSGKPTYKSEIEAHAAARRIQPAAEGRGYYRCELCTFYHTERQPQQERDAHEDRGRGDRTE